MTVTARRMRLRAAAIAIALGGAACQKPPAPVPPPPEVYVTDVIQKDVPLYLDLVGQTTGFQDVDIRARVEGFLESMNYQEGSLVHTGDLLYRIDRKPLEAAVAAAAADQAEAEARLAKASNDVTRYTPLVPKQAISQQELDDAMASRDAARAQVESTKSAKEKAALDLGYTRVTAPMDGLIGTTLVKPGNLVGRGENTLLTTISQINPIRFKVGLTEADYLRIAKRRAERDAQGQPPLEIQLTLADGSVYPQPGKVGPIERAVDATTGTLGVQLEFPNPDLLLRPGQYGRARVLIDTRPNAMLVPQRAVQELQSLYSVAVVDSENKVSFRNVKVGPRMDTLWVIEDGLKPGERVVVEGLQKIRDGLVVSAKPAPAPVATSGTDTPKPAGEAK